MFAAQLMRDVGGFLSIDAFLDAIDPDDLTELMAAEELDPRSGRRLRDQLALVGSGLFNAQCGGDLGPSSFSLDPQPPRREQTPEEMFEVATQLATTLHGEEV